MLEDYADALSAAIEAALGAGEMLRAEFYRPGGPVGTGDHCDAGIWAERLIRERLLSSFPDWAYRGEETGFRPGAAESRHMWLVDPNDGSAFYLKGFRGCSVSIALIRDDEPVLGVVYSYAFPDSQGDLISWAEGCGPVRRQGLAVSPPQWPRSASKDDVVLVSQGADMRPEANLECVSPARFRAIPSIAYRLALVAAGEGVAAVSLDDPAPWDYAAGHALLRGVGGDLLGEDGRAIHYSRAQSSYSRYCFGGGADIARLLSRRSWEGALRKTQDDLLSSELPYPVRLDPGRAIAEKGLLDRGRGALMGQLCGDALGGQVEFQTASSVRKRNHGGLRTMSDGGTWGTMAGQPTDDSELALSLARSLVRQGGYDVDSVARAYWRWHRSRPFDEGSTTRQALGAIRDERTALLSLTKGANPRSQSNGSLMRISPLGILGHTVPADKLADIARGDSALTHPHPVCQEACAMFVVALARAISGGGGPEEVYTDAKRWAASSCREEAVVRCLEDAALGPPEDYQKNQGWVLVALRNAFYQLLHAPTLEEGVVATVMGGGDTDTNAATAGALLGSVHGYTAIPQQWRRMVLTCRPVAKLTPTRHPRPYSFWPSDALELAEKLLAISSSAAS